VYRLAINEKPVNPGLPGNWMLKRRVWYSVWPWVTLKN